MLKKSLNLLSATTFFAIGTLLAVMPARSNPAATVNLNLTERQATEPSLIARAPRYHPIPAWRRRCEMENIVVGYKRVQALTNPKSQLVLTPLGTRIVRSNGLTTQTVPITRRVRVCRTR